MAQEAFCPEHGPYDASLGACPYPHAGASPRPGMPISLDDDLPTDIYGGRTAPTLLPDEQGGGNGGDEGATELPASRRSGRGILDYDEEEATELPRRGRGDDDELDKTELAEPLSVTLGLLWVKEGSRRGRFYPVKQGTVVGRKEGALILDDPKVSSRHAKFTIEDDDFIIWDLASANGTYVNDKRIREATALYENDTIRIGETVFVIKLLEPKAKRKPRTAAKRSKKTAES
ncbi:MAG: FHA domain-containing protein [Anaerolineales bacterium]|nr:FHA domain-containing protein [Anaerolineales bacterium]